MVTLHEGKHYIVNNDHIGTAEEAAKLSAEEGKKQTLTYQVLEKHNHSENMEHLEIKFDSMGVYDNTYVGILQTAYASGLKEFPMPCVFTNCHNCLCAVGGTINTDVHKYAESACKKSGGIFVPPHEAVIHQYMREMIVKSGDMSIVSDSHTRYGTQGCAPDISVLCHLRTAGRCLSGLRHSGGTPPAFPWSGFPDWLLKKIPRLAGTKRQCADSPARRPSDQAAG
mgnify:CR=1 FL=1